MGANSVADEDVSALHFASGQLGVDSLYFPPTRPPLNWTFRARVKKRNQLP